MNTQIETLAPSARMIVLNALLAVGVMALLAHPAHAQLKKCVDPSGKVTYSDAVCPSDSTTGAVRITDNSTDSSGYRKSAEQTKDSDGRPQQAAVFGSAAGPAPSECKFAYLAIGDAKGKQLAQAAKQECLANIQAKARGEPISLEQFTYWNAHHQAMTAKREAAVTRADVNRTAQETNDKLDKQAYDLRNKTYECKPNAVGTNLSCK